MGYWDRDNQGIGILDGWKRYNKLGMTLMNLFFLLSLEKTFFLILKDLVFLEKMFLTYFTNQTSRDGNGTWQMWGVVALRLCGAGQFLS